MAHEKSEDGKLGIPVWAIGIFVGLASTILGGAVVWGQMRTDVESLKQEIRDTKPVMATVTTLQNEVPNLSRRIDEMRGEIKEIKESQSDTQKDIKSILLELKK